MNRRRITPTPGNHAKRLGRVDGLAVGLGIGAAMTATPWAASADPFMFDPSDIAISIDGMTIFQEGTAHATSGMGDFAFADGANSVADADMGSNDFAFAEGTNSEALAVIGNNDFAYADGTNSIADAGTGNGDAATAVGFQSAAYAEDGNYDFANVFDLTGGAGSTAAAANGDNDFAAVYDLFGNLGSVADAGAGSHDIAAVFADGLTADAFGNWMADILPSLLMP
jgi:hypothetical protein